MSQGEIPGEGVPGHGAHGRTAAGQIRLCERCWRPINPQSEHAGTSRPHPDSPLLAPLSSFRHRANDPECTGRQPHPPRSTGQ